MAIQVVEVTTENFSDVFDDVDGIYADANPADVIICTANADPLIPPREVFYKWLTNAGLRLLAAYDEDVFMAVLLYRTPDALACWGANDPASYESVALAFANYVEAEGNDYIINTGASGLALRSHIETYFPQDGLFDSVALNLAQYDESQFKIRVWREDPASDWQIEALAGG